MDSQLRLDVGDLKLGGRRFAPADSLFYTINPRGVRFICIMPYLGHAHAATITDYCNTPRSLHALT